MPSVRQNLCPEPVPIGATGWVSNRALTVVPVTGFERVSAAEITGTGSGGEHYIIIEPGAASPTTAYTASVSYRTSAATQITAYLLYYNAAGTVIGFTAHPGNPVTTISAGVARAYITGTAPVDTASVAMQISLVSVSTAVLHVTMGMTEQTTESLPYFDGGSPGASWTGIVGASTSILGAVDLEWRLGPLGHLVQIRAPAGDLDVSPELVGAVQVALDGSVAVDRIAQPRTWAMQWQALTEDELTYLRAVGMGLVTGPLRLLDPMVRNLLPVQIASGGSYQRSTEGFEALDSTTMEWDAIADPPAGVYSRGVIIWARTTTAVASLAAGRAETHRVPLLAGYPVRVSMWARGAAINARAAYDAWDTAGDSAAGEGSSVALSVGTWTELSTTYTPTDRVSLSPRLTVPSGEAVSDLQTTGWQVAYSNAPTTWALGGGAPVVVVSELSHTYLMPGLSSYGMTLREART